MNSDVGKQKNFTGIVRQALEKACREFTTRIEPLGFRRTKKMWWTRRNEHSADCIYFFRGGRSYGAPDNASVRIRVHFSMRVLNDDCESVALIGPRSDPAVTRAGG